MEQSGTERSRGPEPQGQGASEVWDAGFQGQILPLDLVPLGLLTAECTGCGHRVPGWGPQNEVRGHEARSFNGWFW